MNRPVINNIELVLDGKWITRTFLPLFDDKLAWAEDVKCPPLCPFACHIHPMVRDEVNENMLHKLCTLTVIQAGLVTRKEIVRE
jgi:ATP adenylyltransferase/5',5'''-P-1,P-4-tetraphosphate phosphorylase II